jgi:RND family efflux transporter MFP subunit
MIRLRPLLVLLVIGALAAGIWWWRVGRGPEVTVVTPSRGTAAEIVYATGSVEPVKWAKVGPIVRGRIIERCRCEGKEVKAGQVLARLDDREARHTQRELEARREQAKRDLDRLVELSARGVAAPQSFERAQTELRQIEALIAAQGERIENYRLVSPMDGTVLREDGEVGEVVDTSAVLYRVGQPHPLRLVAEVNEEDIPRVQRGQVTLIRADAFPERTLEGKVDDITPAGDPVAKTFRVYVGLPDDTPLQIGMSVEANIVAQEKADALLVPAEAVTGGAVFVVENGVAVRRKVETGIKGTRAVEILSGVKEGERVVSPVPSRFAGGRVRAIEKPAEGTK